MQGLVDWQQVHSYWFFCRVCMIRMSGDSSAHEQGHGEVGMLISKNICMVVILCFVP